MNKKQIKQLSHILINTTNNVYVSCKRLFSIEKIDDSVFDDLELHGNIFKCIECNTWKDLSERPLGHEMCQQCIDEQACDSYDD